MTASALLDDLLKMADKSSLDTEYRALGLVWLNYIIQDVQNRQENYHWKFLEAIKQLSLTHDTYLYLLSSTIADLDTTKIIHIADKSTDKTFTYYPYEIFKKKVPDETVSGGDPYLFTIYAGYLYLWPVPDFTPATGTTDGLTTAFKLICSTDTFITDGVQQGMRVTNTTATPNTYALVVSVDSETQLTLDTDIIATGENYSIAACVHIDYVKIITAATDGSTALDIPDKYKNVVMDGLLKFAYKFDPELGSSQEAKQDYEDGITRMINDNAAVIADIRKPISHRERYAGVEEFPLSETNS